MRVENVEGDDEEVDEVLVEACLSCQRPFLLARLH